MFMERRWNKTARTDFDEVDEILDLDSILHPAQAFEHPSQVVNDPNLTLNEKRAILASWASDACAIEETPSLRRAPGGKSPVRFDDVMDALVALDKEARQQRENSARYRRIVRKERTSKPSDPRDGNDGQGHALN
jgi:hypothetical protein